MCFIAPARPCPVWKLILLLWTNGSFLINPTPGYLKAMNSESTAHLKKNLAPWNRRGVQSFCPKPLVLDWCLLVVQCLLTALRIKQAGFSWVCFLMESIACANKWSMEAEKKPLHCGQKEANAHSDQRKFWRRINVLESEMNTQT